MSEFNLKTLENKKVENKLDKTLTSDGWNYKVKQKINKIILD